MSEAKLVSYTNSFAQFLAERFVVHSLLRHFTLGYCIQLHKNHSQIEERVSCSLINLSLTHSLTHLHRTSAKHKAPASVLQRNEFKYILLLAEPTRLERNSCPLLHFNSRFGLHYVAVVLSFLRSQISLAAMSVI